MRITHGPPIGGHFEVFGQTFVEPQRHHRQHGVQQPVRRLVSHVDGQVGTTERINGARSGSL